MDLASSDDLAIAKTLNEERLHVLIDLNSHTGEPAQTCRNTVPARCNACCSGIREGGLSWLPPGAPPSSLGSHRHESPSSADPTG